MIIGEPRPKSKLRFDPFAADLVTSPELQYRKLHDQEPVHWNDTLQAWVFTRMEDVERILADPRFEAIGTSQILAEVGRRAGRDYRSLIRFLDAALFFRAGAEHARDRRTLATVMNRVKLSELQPIALGLARELAAPIRSARCYDAIAEFADPLPQHIMARILGLPAEDVALLGELLADLTLVFDPAALATYDRVNAKAIEALELIARRISDASRRGERCGLSSIYEDSAGEDEAERLERAAATALFVFRVGAETTIGLLGCLIRRLIEQPELRAALQQEPELAERLVAEVLRLESNVQRVGRLATSSASIGGAAIRAGDRILLLIGAANRDPLRYDRPDEVDLSCKRKPDVAFGLGDHYCLGASLARMEARVALDVFLELPPLERAGEETWYPGRTIRRLTALPVRIAA